MNLTLTTGSVAWALAAIAYGLASVLLLVTRVRAALAGWLLLAMSVSSVCAALQVMLVWNLAGLSSVLPLVDAFQLLIWVIFLSALLRSNGARLTMGIGRFALAGSMILCAVIAFQFYRSGSWANESVHTGLVPVLAICMLGMLCLEQLYRNATSDQRPFLGWLSAGVVGLLSINFFAYAYALLFSSLQITSWLFAGVINIGVAPLVMLGVKVRPQWARDLYVSRQMVVYTTALTGAGAFLCGMGVVGFLLGTQEGPWSLWLQIALLALACFLFWYGIYSSDLQRWFRAFISKHFFRDRYDYRDEWLTLSRAMAAEQLNVSLGARGLRALVDIASATGGALWFLSTEDNSFERIAVSGGVASADRLENSDEMVRFLRDSQWVVDSKEFALDPGKYGNVFSGGSDWVALPAITVPLIHGGRIVGIARLDSPAILGDLNFKDHDLLKIAGQQIAVFLMQERTQHALAETRQFEAYSKLSAFLMHDLKNLIAQQELVVGNARRFRDRKEFIDDALDAMGSGVKRMRRLLDRFRSIAAPDQPTRVELDTLIMEVCDDCSDRRPRPALETGSGAYVDIDREKLFAAILHAVRNAQDATPDSGAINVRTNTRSGFAIIEIADNGSGMTDDFVRRELFRPFRSTKGVQGMGLGAYQMREAIRTAGGEVEVVSRTGQGTTMMFMLPVATARSARGGVQSANDGGL